MALPNPSMSFSPFAILTAEEMNDIVENIESLSNGTGLEDGSIVSDKIDFTTYPSFRAKANTVPVGGGYNKVTNYTEEFDIGGNFASGEFTAPFDCIMQFNASIGNDNNTDRCTMQIVKNSTPIARSMSEGSSITADPSAAASTTVKLVTGDKVFVQAQLLAATLSDSSFSGFMVAKL